LRVAQDAPGDAIPLNAEVLNLPTESYLFI
jgi:hypothetical protein